MNDGTRRSSKRRATPVESEDDTSQKSSNGGKKPPRNKKNRKTSDAGGGGIKSVESSRAPTPMTAEAAKLEDPMQYLKSLEPLPSTTPRVAKLTKAERDELETVFEFKTTDDSWKEDWAGNLALAEKDILNPSIKSSQKKSFRQPLLLWVVNSNTSNVAATNLRLLRNLLRYVCTMDKVPVSVKKLLGSTVNDTRLSADEIILNIRRASYDPQILKEDGWTVEKSADSVGATGGPYCIGSQIRADGGDAVVIAYVHDPDIGDLWKALWIEDMISFDLEAEELLEARKKWERRYNNNGKDNAAADKARRSTRSSVSSDFTVKGIEYGVVLAASYSKGARPGVYWPARIMHASEADNQGRRSSSKQKVDLVFLAPYWSSDGEGKVRKFGSMSEIGQERFEGNPLLLLETIDATDDMIKEYPYSTGNGLSIAQLQMSFRFTGLPKSAFGRYLNAHRLAMGLREYAKCHLKSQNTATDIASAGLFETHPMSVQAPTFPSVILHLPFSFILSQLPPSSGSTLGNGEDDREPVLQLNDIVNSMKPPFCWGQGSNGKRGSGASLTPMKQVEEKSSPGMWLRRSIEDSGSDDNSSAIEGFMTTFPLLNENFNRFCASPALVGVLSCLTRLLAQLAEEEEENIEALSVEIRRCKLKSLVTSWTILKSLGEESLASLLESRAEPVLVEWRRAVEKIYKYIVGLFSDGKSLGIGVSCVVTDMRCNGHRTSTGCFERPVRLPAALKGAKLAGAGREEATRLISSVPDRYVDLVEEKLLPKTHDAKYLKRMQSRCESAQRDDEVLVLTDASDGEGGEDTRGSRGTWKAAVTGVAGAIYGADMVVRGECVNVFCVTRPPGHHAGRSLHPMKAVSNGFCILNSAACAALYATSPIPEGGLGLSRVCVIDFDVHHGNGTQDILCGTYDPRFLYVSLHAGGAEINGHPMEDDPNHELHDLCNSKSGIYPGRCGDTSPHKGVLNIPLGAKVTPHAVGTALINLVSPRVESFSPELIILSAGFDAHRSDPMGLGGLRAEDFGHITQVACQMAFKSCSGRVLSVLEGGYGVPCCRPQKDIFLPNVPSAPLTSQTIVKPTAAPEVEKSDETVNDSIVSEDANGSASTTVKAPEQSGSNESTDPAQQKDSENANDASETKDDGKVGQSSSSDPTNTAEPPKQRPQPSKLLELGDDLPEDMDDQVPYPLQVRLEKCQAEGFVECVCEHVQSLVRCNKLGS